MRYSWFVAILAALPFFVSAQNVDVTDYNPPVSSAEILRINGKYNWGQIKNNDDISVTANAADADLAFNYFYSSLPMAWFIDIYAAGAKNFGTYSHNIRVAPSYRKYIWDTDNWFLSGSLEAIHRVDHQQIESYTSVTLGYGRYIDATALAKAVRIEEHLMRENVITAYLPKQTMIEIANIIERENEYRSRLGVTYETMWYSDIESEIAKTGLLRTGTLGSIGLLRMQQVLKRINEVVNNRSYGWDMQAGIDFNLSTKDKSPTKAPALTVIGRYSIPMTWRTQINSSAKASTPVDSLFLKDIKLQVRGDYIFELSNRINFVTGVVLDYLKPSNSVDYSVQNLNSAFVFYLENQIYLGLNLTYSNNGLLKRTEMSTSVTLQYNVF